MVEIREVQYFMCWLTETKSDLAWPILEFTTMRAGDTFLGIGNDHERHPKRMLTPGVSVVLYWSAVLPTDGVLLTNLTPVLLTPR